MPADEVPTSLRRIAAADVKLKIRRPAVQLKNANLK
jgi:hypothetical protein